MIPRVILVTPFTKSHRTAEETLALGYLAAVLRDSAYHVEIIDGWLESLTCDDMVERIMQGDDSPVVVGMSCYRSNIDQAVELMRALRTLDKSIPVFCGGYGPTFHADTFIQEGFDVAVKGEAEHIIEQLVTTLIYKGDLGSIPGIAFRRGDDIVHTKRSQPMALASMPWPDRDTVPFAVERNNFVHVCTSRGCGAYCNFCSIAAFAVGGSRTERWRGRDIDDIVGELALLNEFFGVRHFKIVDDSFIEPPRDADWAKRFRDAVQTKDLDIRFRTQVRADRLDFELVSALAEAGWFSTAIGIENAAATALRRMLKQADAQANEAALGMLEANGVYVQMGMILFDPYTTLEELKINLQFLRRNPWPFTKGIFTEMFAAEGTPFTRQLGARGLLLGDATAQNYHYEVQDPSVRRVYRMLKAWHRAHSPIYDWVIDALTAPKVMPDELFQRNHMLCQQLQKLDLKIFEMALTRVTSSEPEGEDSEFIAQLISDSASLHAAIKRSIAALYEAAGLQYNAVANPFLGTDKIEGNLA